MQRTAIIPPGLLWPPADFSPVDMAPGGVEAARAVFGPGLDVGALRAGPDGLYEILWGSGWLPFDLDNVYHVLWASMFSRYGAGISKGPAHSGHNEVTALFQAVHHRDPTEMERRDHEHSMAKFNALKKANVEGQKPQDVGGSASPTSGASDPRVAQIKAEAAKLLKDKPAGFGAPFRTWGTNVANWLSGLKDR